ncbi:helix-hairpin-helix domain-containing protein [Niabella drilacis]|uniref:DNA polymerase (Family 10) n=1 Tax=Niabella drilacis (strain DSM 25811 / CCM 8410 / CCUG 62505 / LMG 26954 / E90) TaxID=1285928 RepID=A0A1G6ZPV0_NIADE|nr:helix-hairpin-helix domain-containing protein [Niabella drilacis]SDE04413.1 DNA polymerase (family 10) [Niabella drilacis]
MNNSTIADHFGLLAKLMDIHGENSFKARTYSIAAFHIERLEEQLTAMDRSTYAGIKGLGASVASKIIELIDTGKMKALEDILAETPAGITEMLQLKGIGPKKIHIIWKEMGIISVGELEYACIENRLTRYKGFGEKTQVKILESINFYNQNKGHFLYAQVHEIFPSIQAYLEKIFGKGSVWNTGNYYRQLSTLHELEFIIAEKLDTIRQKFQTAYPPELLEETDNSVLYKLNNGLRLRVYAVQEKIPQWLFNTSSSAEFSAAFRERFYPENFDTTVFDSESAIFEKANLPYIPACLRETAATIDRAEKHELPPLIQVSDIKGIIHNHSTWSDGLFTIEEMAKALIDKKMEYLVISDHSKSAAYANGLTEERIVQQQQQIDALNQKLAPFKIYKSIECDILGDGSLDYRDDVLATFDLVIASVHSNLYMNEARAMERLMRAIENPYTTILGHLTGRLLLSRNGYPIDHKKIIDACIAHNVVIEINANPHRLDLDWSWIDYAMNSGALLSINPDAHTIEGFDDIRFGVISAQKGGLTPAYNLSSFTREQFDTFISRRKAAL